MFGHPELDTIYNDTRINIEERAKIFMKYSELYQCIIKKFENKFSLKEEKN